MFIFLFSQEAKRRQKEEEEAKRKKDRESRKAEYDKFANASKPNFVISKREDGGSGGGVCSIFSLFIVYYLCAAMI